MSEKKTENISYLSDEELLDLIEDTEKNMTIAAPPDLAGNLLEKIEAYENRREKERQQKVVEYRRFCIRVSAAVAAAIAIICISPFLSPRLKESGVGQIVSLQPNSHTSAMTREDVLNNKNIPSKSEVVSDDIPTKETVLGRSGITENIRDSHYISDAYNKRNGG